MTDQAGWYIYNGTIAWYTSRPDDSAILVEGDQNTPPVNANTGQPLGTGNTPVTPLPEPVNVMSNLEVPTLYPYSGDTNVPLSPEQQNLMRVSDEYVTSPGLQQALSGEVDWGKFNAAFTNPATAYMRDVSLPALAESFSGGATGSGYQTGAYNRGVSNVVGQNATSLDALRYAADLDAQQTMLAAGSSLAQQAPIASMATENEIRNMERDIQVHYLNQGLTVDQYEIDYKKSMGMSGEAQYNTSGVVNTNQFNATYSLEEQKIDLQRQELEAKLQAQEDAEDAAMWGSLGTVVGAGLGYALAPATGGLSIPLSMSLGASLGGSAGLMFGGAPTAGYATAQSGLQDMLLWSMLKPPQPTTTNLGDMPGIDQSGGGYRPTQMLQTAPAPTMNYPTTPNTLSDYTIYGRRTYE